MEAAAMLNNKVWCLLKEVFPKARDRSKTQTPSKDKAVWSRVACPAAKEVIVRLPCGKQTSFLSSPLSYHSHYFFIILVISVTLIFEDVLWLYYLKLKITKYELTVLLSP
jgi:hypothetical protein